MVDQTFLLADLSGFTALTEAHGDEESADVASKFAQGVRQLLPLHGATEVKTIGDAVMVRVAEAAHAVRLGLEIVDVVHSMSRFPVVHVGMNTGPAIARESDWFGSSVNVAARVTATAAGDEVLLTRATLDAAGKMEGVDVEARGEVNLKNVALPVRLYRVFRSGSHRGQLSIDPVCRMAIAPEFAVGRVRHGGQEYLLCSMQCLSEFARDPDAVTRGAADRPLSSSRKEDGFPDMERRGPSGVDWR